MAAPVIGPGYRCRRTAVCVRRVRGSARCAWPGIPSGHAVSPS